MTDTTENPQTPHDPNANVPRDFPVVDLLMGGGMSIEGVLNWFGKDSSMGSLTEDQTAFLRSLLRECCEKSVSTGRHTPIHYRGTYVECEFNFSNQADDAQCTEFYAVTIKLGWKRSHVGLPGEAGTGGLQGADWERLHVLHQQHLQNVIGVLYSFLEPVVKTATMSWLLVGLDTLQHPSPTVAECDQARWYTELFGWGLTLTLLRSVKADMPEPPTVPAVE